MCNCLPVYLFDPFFYINSTWSDLTSNVWKPYDTDGNCDSGITRSQNSRGDLVSTVRRADATASSDADDRVELVALHARLSVRTTNALQTFVSRGNAGSTFFPWRHAFSTTTTATTLTTTTTTTSYKAWNNDADWGDSGSWYDSYFDVVLHCWNFFAPGINKKFKSEEIIFNWQNLLSIYLIIICNDNFYFEWDFRRFWDLKLYSSFFHSNHHLRMFSGCPLYDASSQTATTANSNRTFQIVRLLLSSSLSRQKFSFAKQRSRLSTGRTSPRIFKS